MTQTTDSTPASETFLEMVRTWLDAMESKTQIERAMADRKGLSAYLRLAAESVQVFGNQINAFGIICWPDPCSSHPRLSGDPISGVLLSAPRSPSTVECYLDMDEVASLLRDIQMFFNPFGDGNIKDDEARTLTFASRGGLKLFAGLCCPGEFEIHLRFGGETVFCIHDSKNLNGFRDLILNAKKAIDQRVSELGR